MYSTIPERSVLEWVIWRYFFLWPPPLVKTVMRPWLFRPALFFKNNVWFFKLGIFGVCEMWTRFDQRRMLKGFGNKWECRWEGVLAFFLFQCYHRKNFSYYWKKNKKENNLQLIFSKTWLRSNVDGFTFYRNRTYNLQLRKLMLYPIELKM